MKGSVGSTRSACWRDGAGEGSASACCDRASRRSRNAGLTEAALDVDAENATGAVALYERVGMRVFRRYDTFERRLVGSGEVEANTTP